MRKIHHDLHIPFEKLGELSPKKLLAIDGPKFITKDHKTLAVLISHDKWRALNHSFPDLESALQDFVRKSVITEMNQQKDSQ
jgi:hypothetical protein